jgi:hypothetical protein
MAEAVAAASCAISRKSGTRVRRNGTRVCGRGRRLRQIGGFGGSATEDSYRGASRMHGRHSGGVSGMCTRHFREERRWRFSGRG